MLKTTVDNGTEKLWFEQEISEARAVDRNVGALHLLLSCRCGALGGSLWLFIFFVIEQLVVNIILGHCVCLKQNTLLVNNMFASVRSVNI